MNDPSKEDLLGFVLGALEESEHQAIQQRIEIDPQLEDQLEELKSSMAPLEHLGVPSDQRPGLARRTIEALAIVQNEESKDRRHQVVLSEPREQIGHQSNWSFSDILVTLAVCGVLIALVFPAMAYTRNQAQLSECQNNLRTMGVAFHTYSNIHDGKFPEVPSTGNLATSGIFAPMLKDAELISDADLVCAGVDRENTLVIPSVDQIRSCTNTQQLERMKRIMSGDYGYSLGYMENSKHVWPRNLGRAFRIISADSPSSNLEGRRSANHGGRGQNCLFEDGHWQFVKGHSIADDAIYENEYGVVGAGIDSADNVIGASHHSPAAFVVEIVE